MEEYRRLPREPVVAQLERFSDEFLSQNRGHLKSYRWAPDPMRQWSRLWEYPFCYERLRSLGGDRAARVLDAGSGITFFPYLLASEGVSVACCDIDASLAESFERTNAAMKLEVPFTAGGLDALAFADASFDALYCLSVLEHCGNHESIIDEFHRVLRPNGILVLTFDVSLDGRWDIPLPRARRMLGHLESRFDAAEETPIADLLRFDSESDILTTRYAWKHDRGSLPWGVMSDLKSLARLRLPRRPHKYLSCCALAARRR